MNDADSPSDPVARSDEPAVSGAVLAELQKIQSSEMFSGASRLGDLLGYVVHQSLSNPSRKILAKTIAEEVYGRSPDQDGDNQNIVRVDAGRLRRRLAEYYAGPGQDDPLVIHIDSGGYVPRYEARLPTDPVLETPAANGSPARASRIGSLVLPGAVLLAFVMGFGLGAVVSPGGHPVEPLQVASENSGDPKLEAERRAQLAKSPSSLQAVNLSDHARNLIFPLFEREQLELSLAMFRQAIRKDPSYFGGYAGASQCLASLGILMPDGPERSALLAEARQMVDRAEQISATNSWTQSALSWVMYAEGRIAQAKEHADIALELAPKDGNVLDFYAFLMLSAAELEAARAASDSERPRTSGLGRYANRSINGAANFHLGRFQDAISTLNAATLSGDPISAPTLAYLAASHQALGNSDRAKRYVRELAENWPAFQPAVSLGRLYTDPDQVAAIVDKLIEAGLGGE